MSERERLKMLLLSIVIHAMMMQQFSVAEDINCSRISCESDCKNSTIANFDHESSDSFQRSMKICCDVRCQKRDQCEMDGKVYSHDDEWFSHDDPCISFICDYGEIIRLSSLCRPLICPVEFHFIPNGKCCPECDSSWASFCPEVEECDIACQFGFLRDEQRDCDLCRCSKKKFIESTTELLPSYVSEASEITSSSSSQTPHDAVEDENDDDGSVVKINTNILPIIDETSPLFFIIFIVSSVVLVACILGMLWYCLHQRVYKPIPNVNSRSSSTA